MLFLKKNKYFLNKILMSLNPCANGDSVPKDRLTMFHQQHLTYADFGEPCSTPVNLCGSDVPRGQRRIYSRSVGPRPFERRWPAPPRTIIFDWAYTHSLTYAVPPQLASPYQQLYIYCERTVLHPGELMRIRRTQRSEARGESVHGPQGPRPFEGRWPTPPRTVIFDWAYTHSLTYAVPLPIVIYIYCERYCYSLACIYKTSFKISLSKISICSCFLRASS